MADLDRRTIKPAHPRACIPDPDHRDDLPAEGREVVWSHYWQAHLDKGNILPADPESAGFTAWAAANLPAPAPSEPAPTAPAPIEPAAPAPADLASPAADPAH